MVRVIFKLGFGAVILVLAAGYAGWLHPAGDAFAVFRLQAVGGLAVLSVAALGFGLQRWFGVGLIAVVLAGGPLGLAYLRAPEAGEFRLYQKNMLFKNDNLAGLEADIRAAEPGVLTLQEVSGPNEAMQAVLADVLPHQVLCPFAAVGGVAVATRLQPVAGQVLCAKGLAAM